MISSLSFIGSVFERHSSVCARERLVGAHLSQSRAASSSTRRYTTLVPSYENSPVQTIKIGSQHRVHVKRDDLLGEPGTGGNKARKLAFFRRMMTDPLVRKSYHSILSTGGGQSNAMLAIAHFAREHSLEFHYFSRTLSDTALSEQYGNLSSSLDLGMQLHQSSNVEQAMEKCVF